MNSNNTIILNLKQQDFLLHVVSNKHANLKSKRISKDEILNIISSGRYDSGFYKHRLNELRRMILDRVPDFEFIRTGSVVNITNKGSVYPDWQKIYEEHNLKYYSDFSSQGTEHFIVKELFIHPYAFEKELIAVIQSIRNKEYGFVIKADALKLGEQPLKSGDVVAFYNGSSKCFQRGKEYIVKRPFTSANDITESNGMFILPNDIGMDAVCTLYNQDSHIDDNLWTVVRRAKLSG